MTYFGPGVAPVLHRLAAVRLSIRELEIIDACADGLSYAEVGELLDITDLGVKSSLARIGAKLGVGTRSGIVGRAYELRLLVPVPQPRVPLTPGQKRMLPHVAAGLENAAIARRLHISVATVKTHMHDAAGLLHARTRAHIVRRAVDCGALSLVPSGARSAAGKGEAS